MELGRIRHRIISDAERAFEYSDVWLLPTVPLVAPLISELVSIIYISKPTRRCFVIRVFSISWMVARCRYLATCRGSASRSHDRSTWKPGPESSENWPCDRDGSRQCRMCHSGTGSLLNKDTLAHCFGLAPPCYRDYLGAPVRLSAHCRLQIRITSLSSIPVYFFVHALILTNTFACERKWIPDWIAGKRSSGSASGTVLRPSMRRSISGTSKPIASRSKSSFSSERILSSSPSIRSSKQEFSVKRLSAIKKAMRCDWVR